MSSPVWNTVSGAAIAGLAASTFYFYQQANADRSNPPDYGILSAVNRIELATLPYKDDCIHTDDEGIGKGVIDFGWAFEFSFGVDIPRGWDWNVRETAPGSFSVSLPALVQLNPHYVEFTKTTELNEANGDRWERMIEFATRAAHKRIDAAEAAYIANTPKLATDASASAAALFTGLLRNALGDDRVNSVSVTFAASDIPAESAPISSATC